MIDAGSGEPLTVADEWPYDGGDRSTTGALRRVRLSSLYDLGHVRPYQDLAISRVLLVRRRRESGPDEIVAVAAGDGSTPPFGAGDAVSGDDVLGVLRPVQRYVLRAGLVRAARVIDDVSQQLEDPWGVAHVASPGASTTVACTPPIVEQVPATDRESDGSEFILCDGTHRVVQVVWNDGNALPAVAVVGEPVVPYYAYPLASSEWPRTAARVLAETPEAQTRYDVRHVAAGDVPELVARGVPPEEWYRRYFRDLTTGFGDVGGQGGRVG